MSETDVFVQKARQQFIEYSELWITTLCDLFPECTETGECKLYFEGVVKNSEPKITEQIDRWFENMNSPINPKKTKYAKAIERITQNPAVVYHALSYRDVPALKDNLESDTVNRVKLFEKYDSEKMNDALKAKMWKFLDKITAACYEAKAATLPQVPTRLEIQENIRLRKEKQTDESPSMTKAFQTHVNALCRMTGSTPVLENADDRKIRDMMSRWHTFSNEKTNESSNSSLCNEMNISVIPSLATAFPELNIDAEQMTPDMWKNIIQLNGFSTVTEKIPSKMMGRIEDMASKLAGDIVAGRTDMASVDLNDIGQQVLSGCDEQDMSNFANNIESILPALQNFQKGAFK